MKKGSWVRMLVVFLIPAVMVGVCFMSSVQRAQAQSEGEDACTKKYAPDAVEVLKKFATSLSAESGKKFLETFAKCDAKNNDQMLDFLDVLRTKAEEDDAKENKEQSALLKQQKDKEFQIELLTMKKPVDDKELKKIVTELFDVNQKVKKGELDTATKDLDEFKKTLEEREKNKARIIDRKVESLKVPDPLDWE